MSQTTHKTLEKLSAKEKKIIEENHTYFKCSENHFDLTRLFKFSDDDKNIILYKYYVSCLLGSSLNMIMMDRKYSKIIQNGNMTQ